MEFPEIVGLEELAKGNPMTLNIVPRMNRPERRRLVREGRASGDPDTARRFLIVAKLASGQRQAAVARELLVVAAVVSRAAQAFCERGIEGLYDGRHANGSTKVDAEFLAKVAELLTASPPDFGWQRPTWTRELLCLEMESQGFPVVAVCTMGRALARLGARIGTPKPIVLCPWTRDARLARLGEIRRLERRASADEPVLYSDEVDIHLNPKIGRDWMLKGHQRRIVTPGRNEKFYLAGALDVRTGRLHTTGMATKGATLFCQLLWLLPKKYPRARRIHLIVDNYSIHSAKKTEEVLAALGGRVVLHFLPPYCPDANRIERVWQDLHANVTRNHRCKTMSELLDNARTFLTSYRWRRATPQTYVRHRNAA
jgi:transposase